MRSVAKFERKKNLASYALYAIWIAFSFVFIFGAIFKFLQMPFWSNLFVFGLGILHIIEFHRSEFILTDNILKEKSLVSPTTIEISSISEIEKNHKRFFENGILIRYGRNSRRFLNPKNPSKFVEALLRQNPDILVLQTEN